jgi:hypothetical protein
MICWLLWWIPWRERVAENKTTVANERIDSTEKYQKQPFMG